MLQSEKKIKRAPLFVPLASAKMHSFLFVSQTELQTGVFLTESSVDGRGGGAVDGGDGETVLGGVSKDLADVVTGDDTSGDDIEETHCD